MTIRAVLLATLAFAVLAVPATAQEAPRSADAVMEDYGAVHEDGGLTIMVVHLNDESVEALFTAPTKYSLRVQAKQATMFFVQGTNQRPMTVRPDLEWQIRQNGSMIPTRVVNIANFEDGSRVDEGDQFQGLIVADTLLDPRDEFSVVNGDLTFDFDFSDSQADLIEGR